ncbi:hypothetical protein K402DRAFT_395948 [Aulographum hederae CBS 113979]|uniref:Transcription activator GCR1-like domain-containing protein n=1 Tax=Aulographum hederae CBS 113979 TaxID=1176131 RepID=A0A6G1GU20_9PEZI|nr:hypothetical protein K402DRAFT_395948 [Aulographum hederae CBS 113979]
MLDDVFNGRTQIRIFAQPPAPPTPPPHVQTEQAHGEVSSTSSLVSASVLAPVSVSSSTTSTALPSQTIFPSAKLAGNNGQMSPPKLSRVVNSVPDLWREWTQGLSGQPSIQSLEDQYGVSWRQSPKEKTFFSRRKVIIDCIRTAISRGESSASAVVRLETLRANGGWSLSQLYKRLNKKELIFP